MKFTDEQCLISAALGSHNLETTHGRAYNAEL